MNHADRRLAIDSFLSAFHEVWHPQPFREQRPAWCERWPVLAEALLALDDNACAMLNDDVDAALRWLNSYIPGVAALLPLLELPMVTSTLPGNLGSRWAWEIPGRKRAQIEAFAGAIQPRGQGFIDWCGGKGHLGRLLSIAWEHPVQTLEIDASLCEEGAALAQRQGIRQAFLCCDALSVADWPRHDQHAIALHACGELHRRLVVGGVQAGVARFDLAPCCYYRGVAARYQPLSAASDLTLTSDDVRLAVTETVTASPRLARQRDQEMAWKLAFSAWREAVQGGGYRSFKPVPGAWLRGDFPSFMTRMAIRAALPQPEPRQHDAIEATGWQRQRDVMRLSIPRHAFRRAIELWLILDLVNYLQDNGYVPTLSTFCDRRLTPRNVLISAERQ